jgi:chromosomal replication initiation ATPase DnaA
MSRQLTFALPTTVDYSLPSLYPLGCQADARTWLNNWRDWPNHGLVLMGEQASGKTHLAQVWLELAQQQPQGQLLRAADLAPERLAATLDQLAAVCPLVVVDDADQLASLSAQEGALHLYHAVQRRGGYLLLTARSAPAQVVDKGAARWGLGLADWASRVRAMAVVAVGQPSDQDLRQVLSKLFNDRQLLPDPALQDYLLARTERSFASLGQLVAALDAYSLLHQRPITLPLARQVLENGV